jgi:hypothetical protein
MPNGIETGSKSSRAIRPELAMARLGRLGAGNVQVWITFSGSDELGEFNRSSQHSIEEGCDGQAEGVGV